MITTIIYEITEQYAVNVDAASFARRHQIYSRAMELPSISRISPSDMECNQHTPEKHSIDPIVATKKPSDIERHLAICPQWPLSNAPSAAFDHIRDSMEMKESFLENAPPVDIYHREYETIRQISSGTFGSVHCVRKREEKDIIHAAKYIKSSGEVLHREVYALLSLSDSHYILHFVGYYRQTSQDIKNVLVTEYLEGGDLVERTASKSYFLSEHKCRTIMRQVLIAVKYIHSRRFIHFDLKPFNIVFAKPVDTNNDRDLRIIDFGCAREIPKGSTSVNIGMTGTLEYMSPEVLNCQDAYYPADMWGIGCITYQLLSGGLSPFFDNRSRFRTMEKIIDCNYSLQHHTLRHVSEEALDFVSLILKPEANERMTADQCLSHKWIRKNLHDDASTVERRSPSPRRQIRHSVHNYPSSLMRPFVKPPVPISRISRVDTMNVTEQDCVSQVKGPIKKQRSSSLELIDTTWMRRSLARRRWYKVYGFLRAVNRFRPEHLLRPDTYSRQCSRESRGSSNQSRDSGISEKDFDQLVNYWKTFDKI